MPDRYCPKCHASIHRSQKKRSRPFAQKPICWLVDEPSIHHNITESAPGDLGGGNGLAHARTTLSRVQALLTADNSLGLLDDLLGLGQNELDVAGVGHVGVDLDHTKVRINSLDCHASPPMRYRVKRTRPWAR